MVYTHLRPWHIQYICTVTSVYAKRLFLERFAWVLFHFLYTNQKHMWYRLNQKSALHTLTFECDPLKQAEVADILLMSYEPFEMTEWIMIRHTYAEVVRRLADYVFDSMWSLSVFTPYWVLSIEHLPDVIHSWAYYIRMHHVTCTNRVLTGLTWTRWLRWEAVSTCTNTCVPHLQVMEELICWPKHPYTLQRGDNKL